MSEETTMTKTEPQAATWRQEAHWIAPAVDIHENADEFLLVADLPGVRQDGVHIHYERGQIDLEAKRELENIPGRLIGGDNWGYSYRRSFSVPGTIDVDRIAAELKAGVLFLRLPKSEAAKPKQIPVRAG